jgi:molybdate transport system permease protein
VEGRVAGPRRITTDGAFLLALSLLAGVYVFLVAAMLVADASYTTPGTIWERLGRREIQYAIKLSLISSTVSAILSLWVGVPLGYLLSRRDFPGKRLVDTLIEIPVVLPPLVVGLSLLILFQTAPGRALQEVFPVTYAIPSVVIAQFAVSAAFAARTMRATFDQLDPRAEHVALTLGASRAQTFWRVVLPEARVGILTAFTLAWARALGEFGPILVFAGTTRGRTEVLSSTVFLELSIGDLEAAVAVSLLMVALAVIVLLVVRLFGSEDAFRRVARA